MAAFFPALGSPVIQHGDVIVFRKPVGKVAAPLVEPAGDEKGLHA
jgi:hypothetical protein